MAKAKAIYVKMVRDHPPMSRKEFAQIGRRSNKSGIPEVTQLIRRIGKMKYVSWQCYMEPKVGHRREKDVLDQPVW